MQVEKTLTVEPSFVTMSRYKTSEMSVTDLVVSTIGIGRSTPVALFCFL